MGISFTSVKTDSDTYYICVNERKEVKNNEYKRHF